jgi:hypothetical protein
VATGQVVTVDEGRLYALVHPYELDGRPSSHPVEVRGHSTMNCYLLLEDDAALLYSTGYSLHEEALLAQLSDLVGDRKLTLVIPRVEFPSMCNARPIADRHDVERIYMRLPTNASDFLNFREGHAIDATDSLRSIPTSTMPDGGHALIGASGRRLDFIFPELRLLPCDWAFDVDTHTLFPGDVFAWIWQDRPEGPWLLDDRTDDPTTPERVATFLLRNRYWWLAGADVEPLRESVAQLFERYDIRVIAPDHGAILRGAAVDDHREMLDAALAEAGRQEPVGVEVGRWTFTPVAS